MIQKVENILQPTADDEKAKNEVKPVEVAEADLNSDDDASGRLNRRVRRDRH